MYFLHSKLLLFLKIQISQFYGFYNGMIVFFRHNAFQQFSEYKGDPGRALYYISWWPLTGREDEEGCSCNPPSSLYPDRRRHLRRRVFFGATDALKNTQPEEWNNSEAN